MQTEMFANCLINAWLFTTPAETTQVDLNFMDIMSK